MEKKSAKKATAPTKKTGTATKKPKSTRIVKDTQKDAPKISVISAASTTPKVLKKLQEIWHEGNPDFVKTSTLESLGLNTKKSTIKIGNFELREYIFHDHYELSIIDKRKDLDNKPIEENHRALKYLKEIWKDGEREVKASELMRFNLNTKLDRFRIGNFNLEKQLIFNSYNIDLS